jgi:GNAT superfamily N-acetyltransferase
VDDSECLRPIGVFANHPSVYIDPVVYGDTPTRLGERPSPEQRGAGEVGAINLDPSHWGKGIGRSLLRDAMGALWSLGYREAILWVVPQNIRARSLYENEGWCADGAVSSDDVLGVTVTEMRYRTELHG